MTMPASNAGVRDGVTARRDGKSVQACSNESPVRPVRLRAAMALNFGAKRSNLPDAHTTPQRISIPRGWCHPPTPGAMA